MLEVSLRLLTAEAHLQSMGFVVDKVAQGPVLSTRVFSANIVPAMPHTHSLIITDAT
jgi:hypothetical protein